MRNGLLMGVLAGGLLAAGNIASAQNSPPSVPQSAQSDTYQNPQQNVHESRQYEQLLCTNPGFRARRIAKECGPLQGSQFYEGCVASFSCQHPASGANWRHAPPSETINK